MKMGQGFFSQPHILLLMLKASYVSLPPALGGFFQLQQAWCKHGNLSPWQGGSAAPGQELSVTWHLDNKPEMLQGADLSDSEDGELARTNAPPTQATEMGRKAGKAVYM